MCVYEASNSYVNFDLAVYIIQLQFAELRWNHPSDQKVWRIEDRQIIVKDALAISGRTPFEITHNLEHASVDELDRRAEVQGEYEGVLGPVPNSEVSEITSCS